MINNHRILPVIVPPLNGKFPLRSLKARERDILTEVRRSPTINWGFRIKARISAHRELSRFYQSRTKTHRLRLRCYFIRTERVLYNYQRLTPNDVYVTSYLRKLTELEECYYGRD